MAEPIIKIKRSSVPGKIPTTVSVSVGEFGINTYDGKVYIQKNQGAVGVGSTVIVVNPWSVGLGSDTYNTFFTAGNVGVGTTIPTSSFHVVGNTLITGIVTATSIVVGSGVTINSSGINAGINSVTAGLFSGQNLDVADAVVGIATIFTFDSTDATITNATITNLTGTVDLSGITDFSGTNATFTNITGTAGTITNLTGTAGTITTFNSTQGTITNLTGTAGTITTFNSTQGTITNLTGTAGTITNFNSTQGTITNLTSTNVNASGITTVGSLSVGADQVISSARQLQNIASLDATTTSTIESAIANAPNTFTDITVTGISTFTNGPVMVGSGTSTGTAAQRLQVTGGAYISGSVGVGISNPLFKTDIAGDTRITSSNKLRFGGTSSSTNFYIQYNSTTNSLDFVAG